jgi:hypothetical protein
LEGFHEAVEGSWLSVQPRSFPFSTLNMKLQVMAKGLQAWSDKKVGHVESQLGMAWEILHQLEIVQDSMSLIPDEVILKNMLKKRSLKRTIARLQSRIGWLKKGDANTFFHMHARHRKRKIFTGRLVSEDGEAICTSHKDKARLLHDFYGRLLGSSWIREHAIDLLVLGIPTHD